MEVIDMLLGPVGEWFVDNPWAGVASAGVVMANAITMVLPDKIRDSKYMKMVVVVLNYLAMNVFKNKNAK